MVAYYNEFDPFAAQWLRNLIAAGHIASGDVDDRSISEVRPDDLNGYDQCHFFAGIGVWSHALRMAGVADSTGVWTGSCPCQPFSAAGQRKGTADDRHLWPVWFDLIRQRRPARVFGEQVASKDGLGWFDLVSTDLEGAGYAVGAADLCAASAGAPHIRQRLWFVAYSDVPGNYERAPSGEQPLRDGGSQQSALAYDQGERLQIWSSQEGANKLTTSSRDSVKGALANAVQPGWSEGRPFSGGGQTSGSFWAGAQWLSCADGKARLAEPSVFPLAHGATQRMGRLRAYGNAICPQVAKAFIEVAMECAP